MLFGILITNENQKKKSSKEELEKAAEQYYLLIYKYCHLKLQSNESDTYDITNEVFVVLCEKWDNLKKENIKAWLYRTADNLLKEFFRKHKKITNELKYIEDLDDYTANSLIYEQSFENISEYDIETYKDEVLDELSDKEKELFDMFFSEKLSYRDICERLYISKENLKKRLYRLRQKNNRIYIYKSMTEYSEMHKDNIVSLCISTNRRKNKKSFVPFCPFPTLLYRDKLQKKTDGRE